MSGKGNTTQEDTQPKASHLLKAYQLEVFFDGGCWPNPGGVAGFAWHSRWRLLKGLKGKYTIKIAQQSGILFDQFISNNVAEWRAFEACLIWLTKVDLPTKKVQIFGDSELVVQQANGHWRCKAPHLHPILVECQQLLTQIPYDWTISWIPRHLNAQADLLLRKEIHAYYRELSIPS